MNERNRKKIVYAIFVIAVVWGLFNLPFGKDKHRNVDNSDWDESEEVANTAITQSSLNASLDISGEWGKDPFARKQKTKSSTPDLNKNFKLTAISEANGEYWALINGKTVAVGDYLGGWLVKHLTVNEVILEKNMKTITLRIKGV